MNLLTGKLISMLLLGALSLFFGLIPLRIQKRLMKTDEGKPAEIQKKQRRRRDLVVSCLLCFGAGVLLATVFIHMLPETRENVAMIYKAHSGKDVKHEHFRDDQGKAPHMQGTDDLDVEGSADSTSAAPDITTDSDNNAAQLLSDPPAAAVEHRDHSHDGNHVHRRSAEGTGNQSPALTGSLRLNVDATEQKQPADHSDGNHDHAHDHEASGVPHLNENDGPGHEKKILELVEGSGNNPEVVTESLAASEVESSTKEVMPAAETAGGNVVENLHKAGAGHLHADGDNHAHDHDHAGHDHARGHDKSEHKEGQTDKDLNGQTSPDKGPDSVRDLNDHSGHLHNHGLYDRTRDNLRHDENLSRTSESPQAHGHEHHDHDDHGHDHASQVLPLHKGEGNASNASIQDFSGSENDNHDHDHHGEHDSHDHSSPTQAHAHGEHDHEHEPHAYPIAELFICIGFFFVYLVEEIVHKVVFHRHSHAASKRGSKNDGGIVLKNRHSEEDRLPSVTSGTYRSRSVHANIHPYAAENGTAAFGDFNARAGSGGSLPPKDVWSTSGVDNPSFVNETEAEAQLSHHAKESELADVPLDSPMSKSNSSTLRSFPSECETSKETLFCGSSKKSTKNKKTENNNVPKAEKHNSERLYSICSDYGSQTFNEEENQMTIVPCYDTMGNSLITHRFEMRRHSSPIVPEHLRLQMSRVSVTPHTVGHGHSHMADISDLKSQDWVSNLRSLIIVLALSFHAVFEGLAVGLQQNVQDVWYLFYAIAAHKLVIAFCVGLELISGGTKTLLTVIYMVVFALVTPLGIAIGIIVTEGTSSPDSLGHMWTVTVLQGFAGGTILYVTFCEVLERERNRKSGRFLKLFSMVIGFSTMAIIEFAGGHKHSQ